MSWYRWQVRVGFLVVQVGELQYEFQEQARNELWIIGVSIGAFILIAIIVFISIGYYRKKTQAERQYKKLKLQLDTLESNVRNECKQGW